MSSTTVAKDGAQAVDAYIAEAPKTVQPLLRQLRQVIKRAVPEAEERVSYRMPFYAYHGRLIYFALHRTHIGVYPIIGRERTLYAKELKPYLREKATLQLPLDKPLPVDLITKVVKARAKENEERAGVKGAKATRAAATKKSK